MKLAVVDAAATATVAAESKLYSPTTTRYTTAAHCAGYCVSSADNSTTGTLRATGSAPVTFMELSAFTYGIEREITR